MQFKTNALILILSLTGCTTAHSRQLTPNLPDYTQSVQNQAADEIKSGSCPVIGGKMMPDYLTMRDQVRYIKSGKK